MQLAEPTTREFSAVARASRKIQSRIDRQTRTNKPQGIVRQLRMSFRLLLAEARRRGLAL